MESAGKRLRTRTDIGKDIERCLDDLKITHAELAEMLNVSDKTVDRMIGGKGPTTKYASALAKSFDGYAVSNDADWFCQCDCFCTGK